MLGSNQYKTMADYKGQVIVLNVWATWCDPCKDELPSLQRLYSEYGPKGLKLVAVSIDDYVSEDSIRKFANNFGISFEVLHDSTHAIERVYQTTGLPRDVRHRSRRHDSQEVDRPRRLELAGQSSAHRATPGTADSAADDRRRCAGGGRSAELQAADTLSARVTGLPALRIKGSVQRRVVAAFTDRLVLKATAIFLAIVLWFVVNAKEPQIELVRVRFTPSLLDSSLVLREPLPQIQAIVAGSPKQLIQLSSNPPVIHRQITANSPDTSCSTFVRKTSCCPNGVDAVVRDVAAAQPHAALRVDVEAKGSGRARANRDRVRRPPPGPVHRSSIQPPCKSAGRARSSLQIPSVRTTRTTIAYPDSLPHLVDIDTTALGAGVRVRPTQVKVQLTFVPSPVAHP